MNTLDSLEAVRRLVEFYVAAHNSEIPHSAFRGQTPDEIYYGRSYDLHETLELARRQARALRLASNRASKSCPECWGPAKMRGDALGAA